MKITNIVVLLALHGFVCASCVQHADTGDGSSSSTKTDPAVVDEPVDNVPSEPQPVPQPSEPVAGTWEGSDDHDNTGSYTAVAQDGVMTVYKNKEPTEESAPISIEYIQTSSYLRVDQAEGYDGFLLGISWSGEVGDEALSILVRSGKSADVSVTLDLQN